MEKYLKQNMILNFVKSRTVISTLLLFLLICVQFFNDETNYQIVIALSVLYFLSCQILFWLDTKYQSDQHFLQTALLIDLFLIEIALLVTGGLSSPFLVAFLTVLIIMPFVLEWKKLKINYSLAVLGLTIILIYKNNFEMSDWEIPINHYAATSIILFTIIGAGFVFSKLTKVFFDQYNVLDSQIELIESTSVKLQQQTNLNEAIFNSSKDGIVIVDMTGKIVRANLSSARYLKSVSGKLIGLNFYDIYHQPKFQNSKLDFYNKSDMNRWVNLGEFDADCGLKSEDYFPVSISISPLKYESEMLFVTVFRDQTNRKKADNQKESFFQFSQFVNSVKSEKELYDNFYSMAKPMFTFEWSRIYILNEEKHEFRTVSEFGDDKIESFPKLLRINSKFPELFDRLYRANELILIDDFSAEKSEIFFSFRNEEYEFLAFVPLRMDSEFLGFCVSGGKVKSDSFRDGLQVLKTTCFELSVGISRMRLIEGLHKANEALTHINENQERLISERTKALITAGDELQEQYNQLKKINKYKDQFIATMSHELRTPLNSILGFSQLILENCENVLPEIQKRNLHRVIRNANVLLSMINEILDLSKIDSGNMEVANELVSLRTIVEQSASNVRPLIANKDLVLHIAPAQDVPLFSSDIQKISRIVNNFLSNAIKFTDKGVITLFYGIDGESVYVGVKDTGVGIKEENLERIFERFAQFEPELSRKHGGTGLGLTICERLSFLLGGKIQVESEYGKGSTFTLIIPNRNFSENYIQNRQFN